MLQKIRDASTTWLAGIILGPLIILFGLWGIQNSFQSSSENYAARITLKSGWLGTGFGAKYKEISAQEFKNAWDRERMVQKQQLGPKFDAAAFETKERKRDVLDRLIRSELLNAAAVRDGISVSAQQLRDAIASEPAFQVGGKFDADRYRQTLLNLDPPMTPEMFQVRMRDQLLEQALAYEITASGIAADKDIDDAIRLSGQKRDLRYVEIPAPADGPAPTDAELQAWYKAHAADYRTQEQVSLEYLELDGTTLPVPDKVDEAQLKALYEQQKNRYVEPEQRIASHILINVPANATAAQEKAAQAKAAALAAQARAPGADFAALARANSQDEGSKNLGGDLGPLTQASIEQKAFANALFALKPGQVSDPVRSNEGWHVILLREIKPGNQIPFETVRAQLEHEQLKDAREKAFSDRASRLDDLVLKDPTSLNSAARELGMTVQKTPLFTRAGGTGIAADPAVVKAAFSQAVLENGDNSDEIDLDKKDHLHVVVVRVAQHLPVKTMPLSEVRARVIADVMADRRKKASKAAAEALLARAAKGETLDAIAASIGATVQVSSGTPRNLTVPSADLVAAGFRLPHPVAGKPSKIAMAAEAADRYALVEVTKVVDGNPAEIDLATRKSLRQRIAQQGRGSLDARVFVDALRKEFPVQVAEDRL